MFPTSTPSDSSGPTNSITDANRLHQTLKNPNPTIVFVHASWCGHCKTMYPFWNNVCKSRGDKSPRMISVENEVVKQFESMGSLPNGWRVVGFPTIWVVKRWNVVATFNGGGSELMSWVNKHLGQEPHPAITNISAPRMEPMREKVRRRRRTGRRKTGRKKGRGKTSRKKRTGKRGKGRKSRRKKVRKTQTRKRLRKLN